MSHFPRILPLLVFHFVVVAIECSVAQSLEWATRAGGLDLESSEAIAVDDAGNSYVTGTFSKSLACGTCGTVATFGAGEANQTVLTSVDGSEDIFIAKYDSSGNLLWARGAGGPFGDNAWGIAIDGAGNSYVTGRIGRFTEVADFGNGVTLTSEGAFVAKYDSSGNAVWATALTSAGLSFAISVDASGNSYVTGHAPDPVLGGGIITVWKLDASGSLAWTRQATGVYSGRGFGIATDANGTSHVTGSFESGVVTFGDGEPNETVLTDNTSGGEMFLAKYDTSGALFWARQSADVAGSNSDGRDVSTDSSGNAYIALNGSATFGLGGANETTVTGAAIARFNSDGTFAWARQISGNGSPVEVRAVASVSAGSSFLTGFFTTTATFAAGEPNATTLTSLGGFFGGDIFVAKYDEAGTFLWARQAGGDAVSGGTLETGLGIALDAVGNAYATGPFSGSTIFGPGEPNQTVLTSAGETDMFLAKYGDDSVVGPVVDLDIARFQATGRVALSQARPVRITLVVMNDGTLNGMADATVIGVQDGNQVYSHVIAVSDPVGNGRTSYNLPDFQPSAPGNITWTATLSDQDPDVDEVTGVTRVVP